MKAAESPTAPLEGADVWPLSVPAYHALGEAGLMPKNTELLYGFVYRKMSKSPLHSFLVQVLLELILRTGKPGLLVRTEQPITCHDSEPEPDIAMVKGSNEDYRFEHPKTAELVIEVCVSSHDYDRSKLQAYASAGIKECWLVLAPERQIEIHSKPERNQYTQRTVLDSGGTASSTSVPGLAVSLNTLFK